ncbi:hypothetical protein CAEBREN_16957 [Caenorhabditis brenneri]|uniref:Uncharacterized protein n=1 Tax=Caenorhabditis brenneri TaxID=135651 RepID=G0MWD8_CAEBE|nr:hypothetical protein CAEBREN_16957 [Caenorhabditis brenneri]
MGLLLIILIFYRLFKSLYYTSNCVGRLNFEKFCPEGLFFDELMARCERRAVNHLCIDANVKTLNVCQKPIFSAINCAGRLNGDHPLDKNIVNKREPVVLKNLITTAQLGLSALWYWRRKIAIVTTMPPRLTWFEVLNNLKTQESFRKSVPMMLAAFLNQSSHLILQ